jgi:hypothetical protein
MHILSYCINKYINFYNNLFFLIYFLKIYFFKKNLAFIKMIKNNKDFIK